ncbi:MAG: putative lipid II flippase FtsW [Clostridiales bacterium]|nr:putative lipid II flippase FtsW [Clostridiales bacterium]
MAKSLFKTKPKKAKQPKQPPEGTSRVNRLRGQVDIPFLLLTVLLVVIGLVMLLSASYPSAYYDLKGNTEGDPFYYFKRQAMYALLGFAVMYLISRLNYQGLRGLAVTILVISCLLMLAVKIPGLGDSAGGATRWLKYPIRWQPSELGKMGLILYFAARLSNRDQRTLLSFRRNTAIGRFGNWLERIGFFELIPYLIVLMAMVGILAIQHHMSATIQMVVIAMAILFAGGIAIGWFVAGGLTVGAALVYIITATKYMTSRITMWRNPEEDALGKGMQAIQSLLAIGSGGVTGLGLGNGKQKFLYLPEAQNDFIFAVVCEELGLIGACLILSLFALLIIRGYWLALHARDKFGSLVIVGITTLLAFQVFANVAVVTNLFPVTGISLPFFSSGGSALIIQLAEMGLILSISRQNPAS